MPKLIKRHLLPDYLAFRRRPTAQQRWRRLRRWMARALEKLAEGG